MARINQLSRPPPRSTHDNNTSSDSEDDEEERRRFIEEEEEQDRLLSLRFGEADEAANVEQPRKKQKKAETDKEIADELTKKPRKKREVLEPKHLTGPKGLIKIVNTLPSALPKRIVKKQKTRRSSSSETDDEIALAAEYSRRLLSSYRKFCYDLFPRMAFEDVMARIETFGSKTEVKRYLGEMRRDAMRSYLEEVLGKDRSGVMIEELERGKMEDAAAAAAAKAKAKAKDRETAPSDEEGESQRKKGKRKRGGKGNDDDDDDDEEETEAVFGDVEGTAKTTMTTRNPPTRRVDDDEEDDDEELEFVDEMTESQNDKNVSSSQPTKGSGTIDDPSKDNTTETMTNETNASTTSQSNEEKEEDSELVHDTMSTIAPSMDSEMMVQDSIDDNKESKNDKNMPSSQPTEGSGTTDNSSKDSTTETVLPLETKTNAPTTSQSNEEKEEDSELVHDTMSTIEHSVADEGALTQADSEMMVQDSIGDNKESQNDSNMETVLPPETAVNETSALATSQTNEEKEEDSELVHDTMSTIEHSVADEGALTQDSEMMVQDNIGDNKESQNDCNMETVLPPETAVNETSALATSQTNEEKEEDSELVHDTMSTIEHSVADEGALTQDSEMMVQDNIGDNKESQNDSNMETVLPPETAVNETSALATSQTNEEKEEDSELVHDTMSTIEHPMTDAGALTQDSEMMVQDNIDESKESQNDCDISSSQPTEGLGTIDNPSRTVNDDGTTDDGNLNATQDY